MQRMWINQPSTLQPLHQYHATNVLAVFTDNTPTEVYFLSGDVISMQVPANTLSDGWLTPKHTISKEK